MLVDAVSTLEGEKVLGFCVEREVCVFRSNFVLLSAKDVYKSLDMLLIREDNKEKLVVQEK